MSPYGVVPLLERFEDLARRYEIKPDDRTFGPLAAACTGVEVGISGNMSLRPEEINDDTTKHIIDRYLNEKR